MKIDSIKYPNIHVILELTEIKKGLWYAYGQKFGYYTISMAGTKKEALNLLDLHLSYVTEQYI